MPAEDIVMSQGGGKSKKKAAEPQRTSSRARVVSKSMRYVDEDTRREVKERAIQMLEADNYNEQDYDAGADDDGGAYRGGDGEEDKLQKKKKSKTASIEFWGKKWKLMKVKPLERMIVEQGYDNSNRGYDEYVENNGVDDEENSNGDQYGDDSDNNSDNSNSNKGRRRSKKGNNSSATSAAAATTIGGGGGGGGDVSFPNYVSVLAGPSKYPPRHFCSICGYFGKYSCVRCGSKYCSIKCNKTHAETRCMKFGTSI